MWLNLIEIITCRWFSRRQTIVTILTCCRTLEVKMFCLLTSVGVWIRAHQWKGWTWNCSLWSGRLHYDQLVNLTNISAIEEYLDTYLCNSDMQSYWSLEMHGIFLWLGKSTDMLFEIHITTESLHKLLHWSGGWSNVANSKLPSAFLKFWHGHVWDCKTNSIHSFNQVAVFSVTMYEFNISSYVFDCIYDLYW